MTTIEGIFDLRCDDGGKKFGVVLDGVSSCQDAKPHHILPQATAEGYSSVAVELLQLLLQCFCMNR